MVAASSEYVKRVNSTDCTVLFEFRGKHRKHYLEREPSIAFTCRSLGEGRGATTGTQLNRTLSRFYGNMPHHEA